MSLGHSVFESFVASSRLEVSAALIASGIVRDSGLGVRDARGAFHWV